MGKLLTLSFALVGLRNAISRRRTACTKRDLTEVPDGMVRQAGGSIGDSNFEVGVVTAGQAAAASAGGHEQPNLTHHFTGQPVARHGPLCFAARF